ncbi:MAG: transglutaminase domain-containing protein [Methanobacteriaceae archaeon]|nr:transglutaminase domain-containing protein [Methanobacteriaceae archaeon]
MIKKSSFVIAILIVMFLAVSSVSAINMDNNSGDEILNSVEISDENSIGINSLDSNSIEDPCESSLSVVSSDNSAQLNVVDDVSNPVTATANVVDSNDVNAVKGSEITSSAVSLTSSTISIADIIKGASSVKQYVLKNNKLPNTVTVNGVSYSISQFSYLMAQAIKSLDSSKTSKITVINIADVKTTSGSIDYTAKKTAYLKLVNVIVSSGLNKNTVPEYSTIDGKKIDFRVYTYGFAKILDFYTSNKRLPNSCEFDSSVFVVTPKVKYVTVSEVIKAAKTVKSTVGSKNALPTTVTVGSYKVTISQFSYLMAQAIKNINAKKTSAKIKIINIKESSNTTGSINVKVSKSAYLTAVNTVIKSASSNKVPDYVTLSKKKAYFKVYTYGFAKILVFYNSNKRLPNTCVFDSSVYKKPSSKYVTVSQIATAAKSVKSYVVSNNKLPSTVTVGGNKLTIAQFSYVLSEAVKNINAKKTSAKIYIIDVAKPSYKGQTISKTISAADVLKIAKDVSSKCKANNKAPDYELIGGKKANFDLYTYVLTKDLAFYKDNGRLANTVKALSSDVTPQSPTYKKGVNEKCTAKDLSPYLKASGHCALNSKIKTLAKSLTKNCKTDKEKAVAIFTYVRDKVDYSFYYNSKKSASGALSSKKANCCDKSNLIVALCRSSGIAARYCHSTSCHFSSGLTCGHVWVQILVGDIWYCADATSTRNSLGVIKNWNTNKITNLNQYASLPF